MSQTSRSNVVKPVGARNCNRYFDSNIAAVDASRTAALRFQARFNALRTARMEASSIFVSTPDGIRWRGRRYDRSNPEAADVPNQAINHASSAVEGAALAAVAATGTISALGFIHEDSSNAFALDISDLFRDSVLLPVAFRAAGAILRSKEGPVERVVRRIAGQTFRQEKLVPNMIDRIKFLIDGDDSRR